MNINTHLVFGAVIAALFIGKPEAVALAALGSVIPDLDRPYWFIPKKRVAEEEYHRAFIHNIVALSLVYLINGYLALGFFSHLMLDSMTTVKDRGVEWLFPFTRIVSRDYWSQAEVQVEPLVWIPWRRTYGPSLNGHMLDTYVFLCSVAVLLSWTIFQSFHHYLDLNYWFNPGFLVFAASILLLFASGEYQQRWPNWSAIRKTLAVSFLALALLAVAFVTRTSWAQGVVFSWKDVPGNWLLRTNGSLNAWFLTSALVCALIILRFIRKMSLSLANYFPSLCTRIPSRDFIIDEKKGEADVFV